MLAVQKGVEGEEGVRWGLGLVGDGVRADWKHCWMNHRWQLLVPISADILRSLTWKKSTFYLKKVPFKKSVLIFLFFTLSPSSLSKVCSSFIVFLCLLLISLLFNPSVFTRSRLRRLPLRTPDLLRQCQRGQCPQWADERSSVICIRSLSCPIVPCVSVPKEGKWSSC